MRRSARLVRRSARALSAAVLAGAALGVAVPLAHAEPAGEVSPESVSPGGSVTVSVTCDPTGGPAPGTIDAVSQAFEAGTVQLRLVSGGDAAAGPTYSGTARIAPAENLEGAEEGVGPDSAWTVDGACPAAPGGKGMQWSVTFTVNRGSATPCAEPHAESCATSKPCAEPHAESCATSKPCAEPHAESCASATPCSEPHAESCASANPCTEPHADSCGGAVIQHGVRAGEGGTFTDSVAALASGGLLIAGALGAAVHRLRRKGPNGDG
jgi:hypothetical protein